MGVLSWIVLGLVAGAIAKILHRRAEPGGLFGALAVSLAGAVIGGLIASAVWLGTVGSLGTWIIAILGALLLLGIDDLLASTGRHEPQSS